MTKILLLLAPAAAFVAPAAGPAVTQMQSKETLVDLAEANGDALGRGIGFWDPLKLSDGNWWGIGNEATIGYLRHAEIKHGRVAMAGFLGFCAQSTPLVSGEHVFAPYKGYVAGVSPQEQWDNIPQAGKLQIIAFIGMLESYHEGANNDGSYVHYTKGGLPGYFPPIKGKAFGQIPLDLWDPFGLPGGPSSQDAAAKERGRQVEINNGRLAQIGLLSLLSESQTPGSVPALAAFEDFPTYSGNVMAPFSNDFASLL